MCFKNFFTYCKNKRNKQKRKSSSNSNTNNESSKEGNNKDYYTLEINNNIKSYDTINDIIAVLKYIIISILYQFFDIEVENNDNNDDDDDDDDDEVEMNKMFY